MGFDGEDGITRLTVGITAFFKHNRLVAISLVLLAAFIIVLGLYVDFKDKQLASSRMGPKDFYLTQNAFLATAIQSAGGAVLLVGLIIGR